jgi:hypothetical protein
VASSTSSPCHRPSGGLAALRTPGSLQLCFAFAFAETHFPKAFALLTFVP